MTNRASSRPRHHLPLCGCVLLAIPVDFTQGEGGKGRSTALASWISARMDAMKGADPPVGDRLYFVDPAWRIIVRRLDKQTEGT